MKCPLCDKNLRGKYENGFENCASPNHRFNLNEYNEFDIYLKYENCYYHYWSLDLHISFYEKAENSKYKLTDEIEYSKEKYSSLKEEIDALKEFIDKHYKLRVFI